MLQTMGYAIAIAALLGAVGLCVEQLLARWSLPRRAAWCLAMLMSTLFPLLMMSSVQPVAAAADFVLPVGDPFAAPAVATTVAASVPAEVPAPLLVPVTESATWWQPLLPPDRTILLLWIAVSSMLLLYVCACSALLHYRAMRWRRETVVGHEVVVSTDTGPAVLGALQPRIVVPAWCLEEPEETRMLIIQHEQQHVAARDPLLMWAAVLVVVAVPWNLPLWWQVRRLRHAIELDCDARVLRSGANADSYGEVLLAVTRRAAGLRAVAITMGQPISALERRIRNLLRVSPRHARLRTVGSLLAALAGAAAAGMIEAPIISGMGPDIGSRVDESSLPASRVTTVVTGSGGAAAVVGVASEARAVPRAAADPELRDNRPAAPASAAAVDTSPAPQRISPPVATEPTVVATGEHFSTTGASGVTQCWQCVVTFAGESQVEFRGAQLAAESVVNVERRPASAEKVVRVQHARFGFQSGAQLSGESVTFRHKPDGTGEITGELLQLASIPPHFDQDRNVILDVRASVEGQEPETSEHIVTLGKEAIIYSGSTYPYQVAVTAVLVDGARMNLAFAFTAPGDNTAAGSSGLSTMLVNSEFGSGNIMTFGRKQAAADGLTLAVTPRRK